MPKISIDGLSVRYRRAAPPPSRTPRAEAPGPGAPTPTAPSASSVAPEQRPLPPLLLVHGAAGGIHVWLDQITGLSSALEVVAVDLPGHGGSPTPSPPLDIPGHADVLSRLLAELRLSDALVVGHSMGGAVALTLALAHPEQVAGIALVATGARLPVSDLVLEAATRQDFATLLTATAYGPDTAPEVLERFTKGPLPAPPEVIQADFLACRAFDVRDRLPEVAAPALVIGGSADALVGQGRLRQLAAGLPQARLLLIEGAGHMVMQERAEEVNRALGDFARSLSPDLATPPQEPT